MVSRLELTACCVDNRHAEENPDAAPLTMKCGYHAIPSMRPLHIHIISQVRQC